MTVSQTNDRGQWVPAIPLPHFLAFGRCECECGKRFASKLRYREHYAIAHVMGLG